MVQVPPLSSAPGWRPIDRPLQEYGHIKGVAIDLPGLLTRGAPTVPLPPDLKDHVLALEYSDGFVDYLPGEMLANMASLAETLQRLEPDPERGGLRHDDLVGASLLRHEPALRGPGDGSVFDRIRQLEALFVPSRTLVNPEGRPWRPPESNAAFASGGKHGKAPLLLLLHGTFSSPRQAFAGLLGTPEWIELVRTYGSDRVLAFPHRTVSQSPVANATELAELLPEGARVDIISHSRGGLVGELLRRGATLKLEELRQLDSRQDAGMHAELAALQRTLVDRRIRVGRFVRVACPSRGTVLAGTRLYRYLSLFVWLIARTLPADDPVINFAQAILMTILQGRERSDRLPGLAVMDPNEPLLRALLEPYADPDDRLCIAGATEGSGLGWRTAVWAARWLFGGNNDFVVPSASMLDGNEVGRRDHVWQDPAATHSAYFHDPRIREAMLRHLTGTRGTSDAPRTKKATTPLDPRPRVLLIPGILGSRLKHGEELIWASPWALARGHFARLVVADNDRITPDGSVPTHYWWLAQRLELAGFEVTTFAYDWRRTLKSSADELDKVLRAELARSKCDVHIVAHSMGGLLARDVLLSHLAEADAHATDDAYVRRSESGKLVARGRMIVLGPPFGGSHALWSIYRGDDRLIRLLAAADGSNKINDLVAIIRAFPGVADLLPSGTEPAVREHVGLAAANWERSEAYRKAQAEAVDAQGGRLRELDGALFCVRGSSPSTPQSVRLAQGALSLEYSDLGDGRVLDSANELPGLRYFFAKAGHGELPRSAPVVDAIIDLLRTGDTRRLANTRERTGSGYSQLDTLFERSRPTPLRGLASGGPGDSSDDAPMLIPSVEELLTTALGGSEPAPGRWTGRYALTLRAVHGGAHTSPHPVLLARYAGDPIGMTESDLDGQIDGRLVPRLRSESFTGEGGQSSVVFAAGRTPPAVILLGLGPPGELQRAPLETWICRALTSYAHHMADLRAPDADEPAPGLTITVLPIGANEGESLTLRDSLHATVAAVVRANRSIDRNDPRRPMITTLQFVEHYEDTAEQIAHLLRDLDRDPPLLLEDEELLVPSQYLVQEEGYRGRRPPGSDTRARWEDLDVRWREPDRITFTLTSNRAGTRELESTLPLRTLTLLRRRDIREPQALHAQLLRTATPPEVREMLASMGNIRLRVDRFTAGLPWELLLDPRTRLPVVVQQGLIRTLVDAESGTRRRLSQGRRAVLLADPAAGPDYPPLLASRAEVHSIDNLLSSAGYEVESRVGGQGMTHWSTLADGEYQVLHIAAHGTPDGRIVLGEGFELDARGLALDAMPSLVFLNCCHAGIVNPPRFAADLASDFMRAGVRAFVAAGWPIADGAARCFAEALYDSLLDRRPLGRAVQEARRITYQRFPALDTWGAFQVYGDPHFVLDGAARSYRERARPPALVHPRSVFDALLSLQGESRGLPHTRRGQLVERLVRLDDSIPKAWREAELLRRLGVVYQDLGATQRMRAVFAEALRSPALLESQTSLFEYAATSRSLAIYQDTARRTAADLAESAAAVSDLEHLAHLGGARAALSLEIARLRHASIESSTPPNFSRLAIAARAFRREPLTSLDLGFACDAEAGVGLSVDADETRKVTGWLAVALAKRATLEPDALKRVKSAYCKTYLGRATRFWANILAERFGLYAKFVDEQALKSQLEGLCALLQRDVGTGEEY